MAFGVSKRKLNLGTTNTHVIFLLLFNSLFPLAYDDKRLSTAVIGNSLVFYMQQEVQSQSAIIADVILIYLC